MFKELYIYWLFSKHDCKNNNVYMFVIYIYSQCAYLLCINSSRQSLKRVFAYYWRKKYLQDDSNSTYPSMENSFNRKYPSL